MVTPVATADDASAMHGYSTLTFCNSIYRTEPSKGMNLFKAMTWSGNQSKRLTEVHHRAVGGDELEPLLG